MKEMTAVVPPLIGKSVLSTFFSCFRHRTTRRGHSKDAATPLPRPRRTPCFSTSTGLDAACEAALFQAWLAPKRYPILSHTFTSWRVAQQASSKQLPTRAVGLVSMFHPESTPLNRSALPCRLSHTS